MLPLLLALPAIPKSTCLAIKCILGIPEVVINFAMTAIEFLNKAGHTATLVACGWAGAVLEVTRASGQELYAQKAQKRQKSKKGTD